MKPRIKTFSPLTTHFVTWIVKKRKEKRMTVEQLADASDLSLTTMNNIEKGRSGLNLDTVDKILKALGASAETAFRMRK